MYTSQTLNNIQLQAGSDVQKEIDLLEIEVLDESTSMDVYTRLSQLYTAERNYGRSTEIIKLAIDMLSRDPSS
jgi:hypothetical protein